MWFIDHSLSFLIVGQRMFVELYKCYRMTLIWRNSKHGKCVVLWETILPHAASRQQHEFPHARTGRSETPHSVDGAVDNHIPYVMRESNQHASASEACAGEMAVWHAQARGQWGRLWISLLYLCLTQVSVAIDRSWYISIMFAFVRLHLLSLTTKRVVSHG